MKPNWFKIDSIQGFLQTSFMNCILQEYLNIKFQEFLVDFPTLHIIGDDDQVICREMSDEMLTYFNPEKTVVARHEGGHIIPTKGDVKTAITEFINKMKEEFA